MPLRKKYPITQWLLHSNKLNKNDRIAYWDDIEKREVIGIVTRDGKDCTARRVYFKLENCPRERVIDVYDNIVYVVHKEEQPPGICSCGAGYTSNKKWHLRFCKLYVKGD